VLTGQGRVESAGPRVAATVALVAVGASACDTGTSDYKHAGNKGTHDKATGKRHQEGRAVDDDRPEGCAGVGAVAPVGGWVRRAGLIGQLTSKSGEQFTPAQAAFAAHKVGY
jgi:hypothetical protein